MREGGGPSSLPLTSVQLQAELGHCLRANGGGGDTSASFHDPSPAAGPGPAFLAGPVPLFQVRVVLQTRRGCYSTSGSGLDGKLPPGEGALLLQLLLRLGVGLGDGERRGAGWDGATEGGARMQTAPFLNSALGPSEGPEGSQRRQGPPFSRSAKPCRASSHRMDTQQRPPH